MSSERAPDPVPAITSLDGWSLEPFRVADAPVLAELMEQRGHRYVLDVSTDPELLTLMLQEVLRQPWALPMALMRDDECVGFATTALPNIRALHASVTALLVDPAAGQLPVALFLRHVFWSFPLHRLHTQIPAMDLTREYVTLLESVGFVDEGRLLRHAVIAGQEFDVVVLGLLRTDFEAWCEEHEPRLALR